jgi:TrmH family RNA methyltransferase
MKQIASRQNALVRTFRDLAETPDPAGVRLLLDGVHLVRDAQAAAIPFEAVAVAASRLDGTEEGDVARAIDGNGAPVFSVSDAVFSALSPVRAPSGIVAIVRRQPISAAAIWSRDRPFVLAAIDIQDPGNLGSLLRAGESGGATGAIVCGSSANPFSWKAVRGSMGSILRFPVATGVDSATIPASAKQAGVRTIAAVPRDGRDPDSVNWKGSIALLLGGEGAGLGESLIAQCDDRVTLPMARPVESLNVAVAGAILVYAARRQRVHLDDARGRLSDSRRL